MTGARAIYGLFRDADQAQRAVDGLRHAGIPERDIVVQSSEPLEHHEMGRRDAATWMYWIAVAGGIVGLGLSTTFLVATQTAWPIVTSAMPIVAWWPNLIIMFEMTMLGAILATVATLIVTALAPGRARASFYDPEISDGYIAVGVDNLREEGRAAEVLVAAGGRVKRRV